MSEIRWTRGWHERAKVEVANGAHLDRDESELALAEIERAWGEIERLTKGGAVECAECRKPLGTVAHADCDAPALGIVGRELSATPPAANRTGEDANTRIRAGFLRATKEIAEAEAVLRNVGLGKDGSTLAARIAQLSDRTLSAPAPLAPEHARLREAAQALCDAAEDAAADDDVDVSADESDPDYVVPATRVNDLREAISAPAAPSEDERAQAERWARARIEVAQRFVPDWEDLDDDDRENEIVAMLPLVREARAAVDRVVDGLSVAVSDGPRLLSKVQAERDTALREIERLKSDLAEAHVSRGWMLDMRTAPLTEASHGPPEDEALRWAEDVLDAAKPPEEADLDMSAAARAISPLVREAQVARRAPLTEDEARGFYVRDSRSYVGNCVLWWAKGRSGYTTHLDEAHVFTEEEAAAAQRNRETDVAMPVRAARAAASMQVDAQRLSRGDIPGDVRAAKEGAK